MRRRGRSRRRNRSTGALAAVALLLIGSLVVPAGSFSTAGADRSAALNVVSDSEGSLGLDAAQSVTTGRTDRLVTVTNDLGTDVTVTVRLRSDSVERGDLVVDDATAGNETSFSLRAGDAQTVEIDVPSDATLDGERAYFHANASGTGLTVRAPDRYAPITST